MTKKKYGYTEEQKRRMQELRRQEYENLPWHIPMQCWEHIELKVLED